MELDPNYAENQLKPTIVQHIDELQLKAESIAYDKLINDKLAALRQAGEAFKLAVNEKVDNLIIQANEKRPDSDDPHYDDNAEIYNQWLDQVTDGIKNVHSFFNRVWAKFKELLDKIFRWIKEGIVNIGKKIANAFRIIKTTLYR